jgi:hypothetical protein
MKTKTVKRPKVVHRRSVKHKQLEKAMTNSDEKKMEEKKPADAPMVEPFGHKNPPIGPKTGNPLSDWNKFRDYEQFNPTSEK